MGLVPAAMKARNGKGPWVYLLNLDLPGGENRWGLVPYKSSGAGMFRSKILSAETLVRDASEQTGKLEPYEHRFVVDDTDRFISKLIEGPYGDLIETSTALWRRACPFLSPEDWWTLFNGTLRIGSLSNYQWSLTLRVNDRPLYQDVPRGWGITRADWPNADAAVLDKIAPWIYGRHSSLGLGDKGIIPTLNVDTVNWVRLISALWDKDVPRVYNKTDSVLLTPGVDYTITHPVVNGKQYTVVDLITDQGTDEITCDVDGIEAVGDGTGALLENPGKQLAHYLNHAVYFDHQSGLYDYTRAPLHFSGGLPFGEAQAYFDALGITASRHLFKDGPQQAISVLDELCEDEDFKAFWMQDGTLQFWLIDHRFTDLYGDLPYIKETDERGTSFKLTPRDDSVVVDGISAEYLLDAAEGKALYRIDALDTTTNLENVKSITLHWAPAYA